MKDIYYNYYWQNDKVRLRATSAEDDNFAEKLDSEAWAMACEEMTLPPVKKDSAETEKIEQQDKKVVAFSIEDLDGNYVGHIQYNDINERHGTFEIGFNIWNGYRKKGYAKAAAKLILEYAFSELRLNKCNADCIDCNAASIGLIKSLGFKQEADIREAIFYNGMYHSRLIFGMTANEYKSLYAK